MHWILVAFGRLNVFVELMRVENSLFRGEEFILAQGLGKELKTKIMRGTPSAPKEYVLHK